VSTDPRPGQAPPGAGTALLEQAFDRDSLYALRSAVAAHAAEAGLPRQRVYDVVVADVHELAANAVRHGAGHGRRSGGSSRSSRGSRHIHRTVAVSDKLIAICHGRRGPMRHVHGYRA
jgi:hypothetical protein